MNKMASSILSDVFRCFDVACFVSPGSRLRPLAKPRVSPDIMPKFCIPSYPTTAVTYHTHPPTTTTLRPCTDDHALVHPSQCRPALASTPPRPPPSSSSSACAATPPRRSSTSSCPRGCIPPARGHVQQRPQDRVSSPQPHAVHHSQQKHRTPPSTDHSARPRLNGRPTPSSTRRPTRTARR